jgi:hypothetical protein
VRKALRRLRLLVLMVVLIFAAETDVITGHHECDRIHQAKVTFIQEPEEEDNVHDSNG